MAVPARLQAEVLEHLQIFFDRLIEGGQIIADHQRARSGQEYHALRVAADSPSAARNHNFLSREDEAETGDGLEDFQRRKGQIVLKGVP